MMMNIQSFSLWQKLLTMTEFIFYKPFWDLVNCFHQSSIILRYTSSLRKNMLSESGVLANDSLLTILWHWPVIILLTLLFMTLTCVTLLTVWNTDMCHLADWYLWHLHVSPCWLWCLWYLPVSPCWLQCLWHWPMSSCWLWCLWHLPVSPCWLCLKQWHVSSCWLTFVTLTCYLVDSDFVTKRTFLKMFLTHYR